METQTTTATEIRPFRVDIPDEAITVVAGSHVIMLSQLQAVTDVILRAIAAVS